MHQLVNKLNFDNIKIHGTNVGEKKAMFHVWLFIDNFSLRGLQDCNSRYTYACLITVMHRITTFRSTIDRIYDAGPIIL